MEQHRPFEKIESLQCSDRVLGENPAGAETEPRTPEGKRYNVARVFVAIVFGLSRNSIGHFRTASLQCSDRVLGRTLLGGFFVAIFWPAMEQHRPFDN